MDNQKTFFSVILFLIVCLFACKRTSTNLESATDGYMDRVEEVVIALDEFSSYEFYNTRLVLIDNKEFLANLNYINYSLDFYDLDNGTLFKRITIERGGPEGVSDLQGFWFQNQDSIFIFPRFKLHGSIIVNLEGEFVSKLNPPRTTDIPGGVLLNHLSTSSTPTFVFNQKIHFMRYPIDDKFIGASGFDNFGILDLNKNVFDFSEFYLPKFYYEKKFLNEFYTFSGDYIDDSTFLLSWTLSDSVNVYTIDSTGISKKESFYASVSDFQLPQSIASFITPEQERKITFESFSFGPIKFDPYRNQIHRVLYLPVEFEGNVHLRENPYLLCDFLLLTYDINFNHLGTTAFSGGHYDPRVYLVGKKGVLFPRIGKENSDLIEDEVVYHVFEGRN